MRRRIDNNFRYCHAERGATLIEYSLMAALISAVAAVSVSIAGQRAKDTYCEALVKTSPKWVAPVGGRQGGPPEPGECGLYGGRYAP